MAASIPYRELMHSRKPLVVLDPMAGSGTTVAVARALGHYGIGVDLDPLASLIATVWCADLKVSRFRQASREILVEANRRRSNRSIPPGTDAGTEEFMHYWFDLGARRDLTALAASIRDYRDAEIRRFLWCAFSRMIVVKRIGVSLAADVAHSRPHKVFTKAPARPFEAFSAATNAVILGATFVAPGSKPLPRAKLTRGDARSLVIDDNTVDVSITSPPYINAIDYLRGHKLSLVWMGFSVSELREMRSENISAEHGLASPDRRLRRAAMAAAPVDLLTPASRNMFLRYLHDMREVLVEQRRVLKPGGRLVMVLADSLIEGLLIRNYRAIRTLAMHAGFNWIGEKRRNLPMKHRYLPPPSKGVGRRLELRMRSEIILSLQK
jgi:hypothetical protein